MYTIIGADGREYGPVTAEQLRQWQAEGRVNATTQTRLAGETDWTSLGSRPEFAAPVAAATPGAPGLPTAEQLRARDYQLEIGASVRGGWQLLMTKPGLLLAGTWVVMVLSGLVSSPANIGNVVLEHAAGRLPVVGLGVGLMILGWGLSIVLTGPLLGGLYWPLIRLLRGEPAEFGDFFAGFQRGFVNLMLANVVVGLLTTLCMAPGGLVLVAGVVMHQGGGMAVGMPVMVVGGLLLAAGMVAAIYLAVCWMFTLPLVVDRQLGFWEAMQLGRTVVGRHWWRVFGCMLVAGLIMISGVIACCVGLVFTLPLGFAIQMTIYETLFGVRPAQG